MTSRYGRQNRYRNAAVPALRSSIAASDRVSRIEMQVSAQQEELCFFNLQIDTISRIAGYAVIHRIPPLIDVDTFH